MDQLLKTRELFNTHSPIKVTLAPTHARARTHTPSAVFCVRVCAHAHTHTHTHGPSAHLDGRGFRRSEWIQGGFGGCFGGFGGSGDGPPEPSNPNPQPLTPGHSNGCSNRHPVSPTVAGDVCVASANDSTATTRNDCICARVCVCAPRAGMCACVRARYMQASVNDFIIKAVASAMRSVPEVNAYWTEEAVKFHSTVDVAFAASTPSGLGSCVCTCACVRARARASACLCMFVRVCLRVRACSCALNGRKGFELPPGGGCTH